MLDRYNYSYEKLNYYHPIVLFVRVHNYLLCNISNFDVGVQVIVGTFLKWPCARNTGRSGSGKNQKS